MTHALRLGAILPLMVLVACGGEKPPVKRPAPAPAGPQAKLPATPATPAPPGTGPALATPGTPATPTEPKAGEPAPAPTEPQPVTAESLLRDYKDALYGVAKCEKRPNSIQVKNTSECLKPLWDARKAIRQAPPEATPAREGRQALRDKVRDILLEALDQPDRTVTLYALMNNQAEFDQVEGTVKKLEALMGHEEAAIAEWAAIARFRQRRQDDAATLTLAKAALKEHAQDRVRLAACQYLGDTAFKGLREHYELLLGYANQAEEKKLIRSCAVTRLGYVGEEKDVKAIAAFLEDPKLQYSAVYALRHGLNTKEAYAAYVDFYLRNGKKPDAIEWGSLSIFVPWRAQLDKFPTDKAVKAMSQILTNPQMNGWARKRAADNLGKLRAVDALQKAQKFYEKPAPDDKHAAELVSALQRALTDAQRPEEEVPAPGAPALAPAPAPAPAAPDDHE